jgi:hypothetical protein
VTSAPPVRGVVSISSHRAFDPASMRRKLHWRRDVQMKPRFETPLVVRQTGISVTKIWLTLLACLGTALLLAVAVLA